MAPASDDEKKEDVVDFRQNLVKKLQSDLNDALTTQDEITKGSRIYWQRVHAVHQAVTRLLEPENLRDMHTCLQEDVATLLGFDAIQLFAAKSADGTAPLMFLPPPPVKFPRDKDAFVIDAPSALEQLFGDHGSTVKVALGLPLAGDTFQGLLLLGSRDENRFDAGLAYEPYIFLARVIERLLMRCRNAP